ncbi:FecR family protein [Chitinophaga flava]|nr:FecR domain-containing protein [Chitinophaga flava]
MADFQPDSILLISYFEGNISDPATKADIEAYIASCKAPEVVQACMEAAWNNTSHLKSDKATDSDWQQFRRLAGIEAKRRTMYPQLAAAAVLLVLIIAAGGWFFKPQHKEKALVWQTITAAPGAPHQLQLPDGSQVTIFPGSSISYVKTFNTTVREIRLSGRAFFNITSAAERPFLVTAGKYTTQVLGTSFEVDDRQSLTVSLLSGKVRLLDNHGQPLTDLQPNQQAIIDKQAGSFHLTTIEANVVTAWTSGQLSFDQEKLNTVCTDLQQWYKTQIRIEKKELLQKRITAEFKQLPLQTVMGILSQTAGFRYRQEKDTIVIY